MTDARAQSFARPDDPAAFGRVVVLLGGQSAEREISLQTGQAVYRALCRRGVDAHLLDASGPALVAALAEGRWDRAWIALHGRGGEDGTLQGLLGGLGIAHTGSGVLGSAICMDKLRTKRLLHGAGLPTPRYCVLRDESDLAEVPDQLGLPVIIKPSAEGSSLGMTRVDHADGLVAAFQAAAGYGCEVFAEEWVHGPEYTAAILGDDVLPLIRIEAAGAFYDYDAKYLADTTRYHCPAGLTPPDERALVDMARAAFDAVGAHGWGRVDLMMHPRNGPLLIEINTVPGMTSHSLVPMAAAAAGIDFDELAWRILATSLATGGRP